MFLYYNCLIGESTVTAVTPPFAKGGWGFSASFLAPSFRNERSSFIKRVRPQAGVILFRILYILYKLANIIIAITGNAYNIFTLHSLYKI